jgi:hypothetical protein
VSWSRSCTSERTLGSRGTQGRSGDSIQTGASEPGLGRSDSRRVPREPPPVRWLSIDEAQRAVDRASLGNATYPGCPPRSRDRHQPWRAALRVFEHAYGRAPEQPEEPLVMPVTREEVEKLSWSQLLYLAGEYADDLRAGNGESAAGTSTERSVPPAWCGSQTHRLCPMRSRRRSARMRKCVSFASGSRGSAESI